MNIYENAIIFSDLWNYKDIFDYVGTMRGLMIHLRRLAVLILDSLDEVTSIDVNTYVFVLIILLKG